MASETSTVRVSKLYRYPVKSMGGEELQNTSVFRNGFAGDRRFAIVENGTGEVACAKLPRKWAMLLDFSARYVTEPVSAEHPPAIEIRFPDGTLWRSDSIGLDAELSRAIGHDVRRRQRRGG
jgi:uncharacterized protein YcbX